VTSPWGSIPGRMRKLAQTDSAFQQVLRLLQERGQSFNGFRVVSVHLHTNPRQFDQYCAAKASMRHAHGCTASSAPFERWLWHGTKKENVAGILCNGFLRDGNERASFGKGVYFAQQADYSLDHRYAAPDGPNGDQYLFLARVLVGDYCQGRASMDKPGTKPGSLQLYDSMVDSVSRPQIFVLGAGTDTRHYPEFVLQLRSA